MKKLISLLRSLLLTVLALSTIHLVSAQIPKPALVGYYENWSTNVKLTTMNSNYNVVQVAFAVTVGSSLSNMKFDVPAGYTKAGFMADIDALHAQGKVVILSIGGASDPVRLDNTTARDEFVTTMNQILADYSYKFDGIDIDLETTSMAFGSTWTMTAPAAGQTNMIDAIKSIMANYKTQTGKKCLLTMAPETIYLMGALSTYQINNSNGGAMLPIIQALRDDLDLLHCQYYNAGGAGGGTVAIDGTVYYDNSDPDYITSMTESIIKGFTLLKSKGVYSGLPASKVAVGLPTSKCDGGTGSGYNTPADVCNALKYIKGEITKPSGWSYTMTAKYPDLGGLMGWSINEDQKNKTCAGVLNEYEFGKNFTCAFPAVVGTAPTITFADIAKTYGDASFAVAATSNSTGAITYTASGTGATITSAGVVTITGAGTVTITASQAAAGTYLAGTKTATLTIAKKALTVTADNKSRAYNTANPAFTVTYSGFVGSDNASSSLTTQATASTTATTTSAVGTYDITTSGAASNNYSFTYVKGTLTVTAITPTITFGAISKTYGDASFTAAATSNSAGAITYTASGTGATITSAGVVTITGAGTVTITATQAANGNYSGGTATATLIIAKKALTVIADNKSRAYNTANPAFTITYSGFVGSDNAASLTTQATASTTATTTSAVGTYDITASGAVSNNYSFTYVKGTLTVTAITPTITFGAISKTYGDASFTAAATSNSAGAITYTASGTGATITSAGVVTITGAGSVTITATQAANGNYSGGTATATLTIAKKALTVTADNKSRAYNTANPAFTITYSGFVGSDAAASLTTQPTASTTAVTASPAGDYDITVTGGASNNYSFTYVKGTLTINAASVPTITFADITKTYGDASFTVAATSNSTGAITYTATGTGATVTTAGVVTITGAGTVTITASQAAAGSFAAGTKTATLTIGKKALTVTADNKSRAYNTANPALTVTYSGFVGSDNASSLTTQPTASTTATITSAVGTYDITASGAVSNNYSFTYVKGTLTVTAVAPLMAFGVAGKTYGDASFTVAVTTTSFGAVTYTATGTGATVTSAGIVTITGAGTVTITATQAANGNYTVGTATATLTIAKKALTVTADNKSRAYNTANPALTVTYAGFVGSDNAASLTTQPTASTAATTASAAGNYDITVAGGVSNNYSFTYVKGTLTVNAANAPVITFSDITKTYGDASFTVAATSNSTGAITYTVTGTGATVTPAGVVTITGAGTVTITASQAAAGSFAAGTKTATLTIAKKALIVTAEDKSRAFNTVNPALTVTYSGFVGSDNASSLATQPTASTVAVISSAAGNYDITVADGVSDNYSFTYVKGTLTINAAITPIFTFDDINKTYGDASFTVAATSDSPGAITYSATGTGATVTSDGVVTITGAGTVTITASQAASGSYAAASKSITLTIAAAPLTGLAFTSVSSGNVGDVISLSTNSPSTGAITYTVTNGTGSATVSGDQLTLTGAGTVTVTATIAADGNYAGGTVSQTITIQDKTTGVDDLTYVSDLKLYPVPATEQLTLGLTLSKESLVKIELSDVEGRQVASAEETFDTGNHELVINVNQLAAGIYLAKIYSNEQAIVRKVLIAK